MSSNSGSTKKNKNKKKARLSLFSFFFFGYSETGSHHVAQDGLELQMLLSKPPCFAN
jgi:hypothetical protein